MGVHLVPKPSPLSAVPPARRAQLRDWSAGAIGGAYTAPEHIQLRLSGLVENHPTKPDGWLITSAVVRAEGRLVATASGSVYELIGEPAADYLDFLASIGRTYDAAHPIKVER